MVLGRGQVPCDVVFIGEAPGVSEDTLGQPFIGPAGKLMDRIIDRAIKEAGHGPICAFTNLVCCIPLGEEGTKVAEPPRDAIVACASRLLAFLDLANPSVIISVGQLSAKWVPRIINGVYGQKGARKGMIGTPVTKRLAKVKVESIIHPAAILRADVSQKGLAIQRTVASLREVFEEMKGSGL